MDKVKLLSRVPLFRALHEKDIKRLADVVILRKYDKNQAILREDDKHTSSMFIIVTGKIKVMITSYEGKEAILDIMEPGDYFGEMSIIDGEPRSASVYAVEHTELLILRREDLLVQIERNPKLALSMLIEFSRRLRIADRRISSLALLGVYGRIANLIIDLANKKGEAVGKIIVVKDRPTHQEIADMTGTTRETVSRVLNKLQRSGSLLVERDKLIVLHKEELENVE